MTPDRGTIRAEAPNKEEVSVIGTNELPEALAEVVEDLGQFVGKDNSTIVRVSSDLLPNDILEIRLRNPHHVSKLLQKSQVITDKFPRRKKVKVTSPTTWAIGAFEPTSRDLLAHGLFTVLQGMYNDWRIKKILGFDNAEVSHAALPLNEVTGRKPGDVSVILERRHLQSCSVINFDRSLIAELSIPEKIVNYPLGDHRFYLARAGDFMQGYSELMRQYGIACNLS